MVSDDHGRETLGCYGNSVIETPHLDSLAGDGVRFTNAFCTTASCAASRSVILTGKHNHTNGTYGHTHANHHFACFDDVQTLPAMIKRTGYRTFRVGKQHYAPERLFPFDGGFPAGTFGRDDVRMSESCRDYIRGEGSERDQPFFLYWCSMNPHRAGRLDSHRLKPNSFGNPEQSFPGDEERLYSEDEVIVPPFLSDLPEVRAELAQYYQSISRLDRGVGRLVSILEDEGKLENTVIMYVSDNGAAFPEAKTTLYEPGMNLPCIVKSPFHENRGTECNGLVTWADITPTLLDFAGVEPGDTDARLNATSAVDNYSVAPVTEAFHGRSFAEIIDEEDPESWRDEIYASHTFHEITNYYPMRVLRTKRHKFIYNIAWKLDYSFASDLWASSSWQAALREKDQSFGARSIDAYIRRPRFELYDIENDPNEINNLAESATHQDLVATYADKLKKFQEETGDPWLHKWIYE
jgi:N-sulfoglucosamine sulfohydrolase